jgi:hypothetical protein
MSSFETRVERIWNVDMFGEFYYVEVGGYGSISLWIEQPHSLGGTLFLSMLSFKSHAGRIWNVDMFGRT